MGYAFISYNSKDQDVSDSFKALLNRNGIKTWKAPEDIPPGLSYAAVITQAIKETSCFILLLSENAQNSIWMPKETERAVNYKKIIIPLLLDDAPMNNDFELMLSSIQAVTIRKIDDNDEKINQLIAEIKKYTDEKLSDEASTQLLVSTKESTEAEEPIEQTQENTESDSIAYFYKNAVMEGPTLMNFKGRDSTSVVIPEGVTGILDLAFVYCSKLKNISIPSTVIIISHRAVMECPNLQSISVSPANPIYRSENNCCIERKTNGLVLGCSKSVMPEGVTAIGENAFSHCENLTEIKIPASVTTIAQGAFIFCENIQSIQVSNHNLTYYSENNCCVETKTQRLIIGCKNSIIPEGIVSIATGVFSGCSGLTDVNLPFGITEIGEAAFFRCDNLTTIKISASVEKIAVRAFFHCKNLQSIQVSDQNSTYYSENNCCIEIKTHRLIFGCKNSIIPEGVVSVADYAFISCSALRYIHIPQSVKSIGGFSFYNCCKLTNIVLPDSVSHIGRFAFAEQIKSRHRRKIFCEFNQKPDGWDKNWTDKYSDVYWKDEWYYDENGNPVVKS